MTNGDKIRQMSDEEILEFFFGPTEAYTISMAIPVISQQGNVQIQHMVTKRFIDWMKEEAE